MLFDLRVQVEGEPTCFAIVCSSSAPTDGRPLLCSSKPGDYFDVRGEVITMPPGQGVLNLVATSYCTTIG